MRNRPVNASKIADRNSKPTKSTGESILIPNPNIESSAPFFTFRGFEVAIGLILTNSLHFHPIAYYKFR